MQAQHDLQRILDTALAAIPSTPIALALSGGLDSTALLHALSSSLAARQRGLRAIHIDHGLHAQSGDWSQHCQRICAQCDVPLTVVKVVVKQTAGTGLEASARAARYAAFELELDAGEILALAHHRDDQTETVLLKLLRGAGPEGLGAMRTLRRLGEAWAWRPLLEVGREELRRHASQAGLEWIEDPSNHDIRIERNFLRHEVLPTLRKRWPRADASIAQSARWIRAAADFVEIESSRALASLRGFDPATLDWRRWLALADALRDPVLRCWLRGLGLAEPNQHQVGELERQLAQASDDKLPCVRWPGAELRRYRDLLYATRPMDLPEPGWESSWNGLPLVLPAGLGTLTLEGYANQGIALRETADLVVRFRRGGERLRLDPGGYHRELRDLFQETGIPPWQRARIPIVLDHKARLLAVGDLWISDIGRTEFARLERTLSWSR
ncbi:MAG: tRNA lysidine(34) synthetase TilS [Xanthomonadales bacterium]|nr:tRNA lysidine(34) synthetase TilS [Xanthomonadales bacterium]